MTASYEFFDNGTMRIRFANPIPAIERNSSTGSIFEVEYTDYVPFTRNITSNGVTYKGFDVLEGNYQIDYSDGQYGSVVIGITLQQ